MLFILHIFYAHTAQRRSDMDDKLKAKIVRARKRYLKDQRERMDHMDEAIAKQVAEDAENAGARAMTADEAINALKSVG